MKKIYSSLVVMIALVLCVSCNDDVAKEQFKQLVSFKANIDSRGVTPIYIRYKPEGKVNYDLPLIVSGTLVNAKDLDIRVALDHDTLKVLNFERFSMREELYYKELEDHFYEFPETANIEAGKSTGLLPISFSLKDINLVDKWILPLNIEDDPANNYVVNDRKHYRKALLRVLPFNDYSGDYNATAYKMYFRGDESDPIVTTTKTAYVVDENTIFIYAGIFDEDRQDRKDYKIFIKFNEDKTLSISTDNPAIALEVNGAPKYLVEEEMDVLRPYLKHIYVTLTLDYHFKDLTVAEFPVDYTVKGTLIMERKINTQIPDEDQAIEW